MLRFEEPDDQRDERDRERDVDGMPGRQQDRLAAHPSRQFQKGDDRAGKRDGADSDAQRHFDQALAVDGAFAADVEGGRRIQRAGGNKHGRHADQRVKRRHQFGHRRHRHAPCDHGAEPAADRDRDDHQRPSAEPGRRMRGERGGDRDRHADHAEQVATPAGVGM